MKKIFVTGGTGFIGSAIVPLLTDKYEVTVLTRRNNVETGLVKMICGDIFDEQFIVNIMNIIKPDILLHLAWDVKQSQYFSDPINNQWEQCSCMLVDNFLQNGGKTVVGAGTCFEYDISSQLLFDEAYLCKPTTLYGEAKVRTYEAIKKVCDSARARLVWGRIFYPYGPKEEARKLFSSVINTLRREEKFVCKTPNNVHDYIHVEDVAGMFAEFINNQNLEGIFNVGNGNSCKVKDVLLKIAKLLKKENLIDFESQTKEVRLVAGINKMSLMRYKAKYGLEVGLQDMINKL